MATTMMCINFYNSAKCFVINIKLDVMAYSNISVKLIWEVLHISLLFYIAWFQLSAQLK